MFIFSDEFLYENGYVRSQSQPSVFYNSYWGESVTMSKSYKPICECLFDQMKNDIQFIQRTKDEWKNLKQAMKEIEATDHWNFRGFWEKMSTALQRSIKILDQRGQQKVYHPSKDPQGRQKALEQGDVSSQLHLLTLKYDFGNEGFFLSIHPK